MRYSMPNGSAAPLGLALIACRGDGAVELSEPPSEPDPGRRSPYTVCWLLGLAACVLGPDRDGGLEAERFTPFPVYQVWWEQVQKCTGIQGEFARLRFFEVVAPVSPSGGASPCDATGTLCPAFWQEPHDIYLAPAFIRTEPIVKHEMIHDLRQTTDHDHLVFEVCTAGARRRARG